jgi:hypothetical protein
MDLTPYMGLIIGIGLAIYLGVGYYFKGVKKGEPFEIRKMLETVILVVLLVITGLMSGVTITAEYISSILGTLGQNPVTVGAIMAALLGLIDQFVKNGGRILTGGTLQALKTQQPKAGLPEGSTPQADPIKYLGFTVSPSSIEGKSPLPAAFKIICSTLATDYAIDFQDGSPVMTGKLIAEGQYNVATIIHSFTYVSDGKYASHSFYPLITVSGSGVSNTFNTALTGRSLAIIVAA